MSRPLSKIGDANNRFRQRITCPIPEDEGRVLLTAAVNEAYPDMISQMAILTTIATAPDSSFTMANDPRGDRDMVVVQFQGRTLWGIIDYYARGSHYHYGSDDPTSDQKTARVLTIMFPEDY